MDYCVALHRHTCVALKITEKLLSDCDQQRIQLIADSYLDMLHTMLESVHTELQIMATNSVRLMWYMYVSSMGCMNDQSDVQKEVDKLTRVQI